jgi:hypothetical protein
MYVGLTGLLFWTMVRPNGQSAKSPMRNDATPNGIPMMVMHHSTPTTR